MPSGARATGGARVISRPSNRMRPWWTVVWPMIAIMVDVLPAPLGPSSASIDPAEISILRFSPARSAQQRQLRFSSFSMLLPRAEISVAHARIRHDLARRPVCNDLSLVEHDQTAAHPQDLREVVLDQHGGDAACIDR